MTVAVVLLALAVGSLMATAAIAGWRRLWS
jgi:hypothetical protein